MSMELGEDERVPVEQTIMGYMRELKKTGDLAVRFIPHRDPVAKREDIIRVTVAAPPQKVASWIRLEDVQFDWPRIEGGPEDVRIRAPRISISSTRHPPGAGPTAGWEEGKPGEGCR